jgi:hypothetical protein
MWCPTCVYYPSRGSNRMLKTREAYLVGDKSVWLMAYSTDKKRTFFSYRLCH